MASARPNDLAKIMDGRTLTLTQAASVRFFEHWCGLLEAKNVNGPRTLDTRALNNRRHPFLLSHADSRDTSAYESHRDRIETYANSAQPWTRGTGIGGRTFSSKPRPSDRERNVTSVATPTRHQTGGWVNARRRYLHWGPRRLPHHQHEEPAATQGLTSPGHSATRTASRRWRSSLSLVGK